MEERIVKFVSALRAGGVRVSLAESADAFTALDRLGIQERETFKLCLRATLIKEAKDLATFEELFPLFFDASDAPPLMDLTKDLTPEEAQMIAEALRQFSQRLREMIEKLLRGEKLAPAELEQLGQLTGLQNVGDLRYREWMTRRLEQALRFRDVQNAIQELSQLLAQMGMNKKRLDQLRQLLQSNQQAMQAQLRQYAGQKIAENMAEHPPGAGAEGLMHRPFNALSEADLDKLRKEVRRLAAALRTRVSLRQKHAKTGQLDAKATLRANLKHGSVPIEIRHRDRKLKPKLVVLCDLSTSMRPCSELMLSLIHALQDQISKTHAFAFIDHLEYISPDLAERDVNKAVAQVLERMPSGYYNTDLGFSLESLAHDYLDTLDSRTTFIVVGDGRNNYNDPRLEVLRELARRSSRTIWLNPEAPMLWGTGDSDMLKYAPLCNVILQVNTLAELAAAVDKLLIQK